MTTLVLLLPMLVAICIGAPHNYYPVQYVAQAPYHATAVEPATANESPAQETVAVAVEEPKVVLHTQYHAQDSLGQYSYGYASSDGSQKAEARNEDGRVAGRFSYIDPDGKNIELKYVADKEGGFRAEGEHLPEAPELPDFLKEAYEQAEARLALAKSRAKDEGVDGDSDHGDQQAYDDNGGNGDDGGQHGGDDNGGHGDDGGQHGGDDNGGGDNGGQQGGDDNGGQHGGDDNGGGDDGGQQGGDDNGGGDDGGDEQGGDHGGDEQEGGNNGGDEQEGGNNGGDEQEGGDQEGGDNGGDQEGDEEGGDHGGDEQEGNEEEEEGDNENEEESGERGQIYKSVYQYNYPQPVYYYVQPQAVQETNPSNQYESYGQVDQQGAVPTPVQYYVPIAGVKSSDLNRGY